ncbi:MAG: universal stress protein [Planctomycetota bacterium]
MDLFKNRTVIVPFDFSETSKHAVEVTTKMADKTTSLHIVHVIEPTTTLMSFDPALAVPPTLDQDRHDIATKQMEKLFGDEEYAHIKRHCISGDPGIEIIKLAEELRANLIVMPSHGRTGLNRLLLGSVAERVSRLSKCPVLILRGDEWSEGCQ